MKTAFGTFSTTSNWALVIPCFTFTGGGFPAEQCYSTLQGTSMAAPHASATLALIASANSSARGDPDRLERMLKKTARKLTGNATRTLDPNDRSAGDLTGIACRTGYCHFNGKTISDIEAYGVGLVDTRRAVGR
jgi:subtilisin family serine protease